MRRGRLLQGVPFGSPIACPLALSHDRHSPLSAGAFRRITPGALAVCGVVLMVWFGGWS
jgi:hypothetical protein